MKTVHTEVAVMAPADIVWATLVDFPGWQRWNPIMKVEGTLAPGERLRVIVSPPGQKPMTVTTKVVRLDPGREFRWSGGFAVPGIFNGEHGFRVVPEDTGRCRFEQFESFSGLMSGAFLARSGKAMETGFTAMNRMLKREAERRAKESA
ncbi:MAG: SRPBCC domain-containing protein [Pseudomonadota bacterium]|nr:SRPBCC domain-containing protein [Pseudomonadota bacterium]